MFLCIMHHYTDKYFFYSAPIYKSSYVLQSWQRYSSVSIDPAIAYFYQYLVQTLLTRSQLNRHNLLLKVATPPPDWFIDKELQRLI